MKYSILLTLCFALLIAGESTHAQTCLSTAPVCVATGNQPAFTYSNNTNFRLQFNDLPGVTEYQFTDGTGNKVFGINAINGKFSAGAFGALQVGADRYAFQFSGDADAGLYFKGGAKPAYQFRSLTGSDILTIDEDDGDVHVTGLIFTPTGNSGLWNQAWGWGNHATQGYLTSESDPSVTVSTINGVARYNGSSLVAGSIIDGGAGSIVVGGSLDPNARIKGYRALQDYGPGKASVIGVREGSSNGGSNGGTGWANSEVDAAVKGYVNWGNNYSAGVSGISYLDYENSAAVIGSNSSGSIYGALGFRISNTIYAGYFNGKGFYSDDVDMRGRLVVSDNTLGLGAYTNSKIVVLDGGITSVWSQSSGTESNIVARNVSSSTSPGFLAGSRAIVAITSHNTTTTKVGVNCAAGGTGGIKMGLYADAIGTGLNYAGYFSGDVFVSGVLTNPSDKKLKKDINDLEDPLSMLSGLEVKTYQYDHTNFSRMNLPDGKQYGLIAQDVEQIIPELVKQEILPESIDLNYDEAGNEEIGETHPEVEFKSVNYIGMIPILVGAVNQLKTEVDQKDELISEMDRRLTALEKSLAVCCVQVQSTDRQVQMPEEVKVGKSQDKPSFENEEAAVLGQNVPNPFDQSTIINYYVPTSSNQAELNIFDLKGQLISSFELETGNGQLKINLEDLSPGLYMYSMMIDGKVIATKKMNLQ